MHVVLYCIVSISLHLYSASCSAHQSEALPVRETQSLLSNAPLPYRSTISVSARIRTQIVHLHLARCILTSGPPILFVCKTNYAHYSPTGGESTKSEHSFIHSFIRSFIHSFIHSIIHSGYFYSASSSPLLLRGAPDYCIDTVSELTHRSATSNCERRTCPKVPTWRIECHSTCDSSDASHRAFH